MSKDKSHLFYGWIIVALSCILIFGVIGIGHNCWSVYTIPMCDDLGITRQQFSNFFSVMMGVEIIALLVIDKIFHKIGQLNTMRIAAVMLPAALIGISRVHGLLGFYGYTVFLGFGIVASSFYALSIIVSNWFEDNRGTAIGIVFMSSPLGSMVMIPLVNKWINAYGWRTAIVIMAAIMGAITITISGFLMKEKPSDMGLEPYRDPNKKKESPAKAAESLWGVDRQYVLSSAGGWLLIAALVGCCMAGSCSNTIVPYLRDIGYSDSTAANVHSIGMGLIGLARFSGGRLSDKFGVVRIMSLAYALSPLVMIGLVLLPIAGSAVMPLMLLGFAISQIGNAVCLPLMVELLFGRKNYSSIYGLFSAVNTAMGAMTPIVYGFFYDRYNSYLPTYRIFLCGSVLGFFALTAAIRVQLKAKEKLLAK